MVGSLGIAVKPRRRAADVVTIGMVVVTLVPVGASVVLTLLAHDAQASRDGLLLLLALVCAVLGLAVAHNQPLNPIGWLLTAEGLVLLVVLPTGLYAVWITTYTAAGFFRCGRGVRPRRSWPRASRQC